MIKTEKKKTKKEVKDLLFGRRAKIKKVKCVICNQIKQHYENGICRSCNKRLHSTYYCRDEGVGWDRVPGKEQE